MKKILLLGAMGFIGKNIIASLSEYYDVVAYDRLEIVPDTYTNIDYIYGNFQTEHRWNDILRDVDVVIHLISTTNVSSGTENIENEICENVIPTIRLLEKMKDMNVKKLVFISSGGTIYGETTELPILETSTLGPICPYGVQKLTIEAYLHLYNKLYEMENLILRVGNPYGIGQAEGRLQGIIPIYLKCFIDKAPIQVYGDGENVRDYIYMGDLMRALHCAIEYSGCEEIFNIGSGEGHSIKDIINLIKSETNMSCPEIKYLPDRKVDVRKNILDSSLFQRETGWKINTDLRSGIKLLYNMISKSGE